MEENTGAASETGIAIQLCVLSVDAFRFGYHYELIDKEAEAKFDINKSDLQQLSIQAKK